jgi:hypothetical protein
MAELTPKPDVHRIVVQLSAPKGSDPGRVTTGYYTVEDSVLTMTDASGVPIRRSSGDFFTRKLEPDENPRKWAGIYTKEIRRSIHGDPRHELDMSKWGAIV